MTTDAGARMGAGGPRWPQSLEDLRDRQLCPACFTPLTVPRCSNCHLDLRTDRATDLLQSSLHAAKHLERRSEIIELIRADSLRESIQLAAAPPARPPVIAAPAPVAAPPVVSAPVPLAAPMPVPVAVAVAVAVPAPAPAPAPTQPSAPAANSTVPPKRKKRFSVQLLLLVVGVSLVAVALVFFLIVAWFVAGLMFRAAIIALVTLLMFAAVSVLTRFKLHSTAQGVAVLAVLLVYLDLWAVQATGLFGADDADSALYWAIGLLASAPLLLFWFRLTGMRAASLAGFTAVPVGAGLLAWAIGAPLHGGNDGFTRMWLVALGVIAASLVQLLAPRLERFAKPTPSLVLERGIVLGIAGLMLPTALILALFIVPEQVITPLWSLGALALVLAVHVQLNRTGPGLLDRIVATVSSTATGFSLAAIPVAMGYRVDSGLSVVLWPALASIALMLILDVLRTRAQDAAGRRLLLAASVGAGVPVSGALAVASWILLGTYLLRSPLAFDFVLWQPVDPALLQPRAAALEAALLLAGGTALAVAIWTVSGIAARRSLTLGGLVVASALGGATLIAAPAAASLTYLTIGAAALCALIVPAVHNWLTVRLGMHRLGVRWLGIAALVVSSLAGYLLSVDSLWLWLLASAIVTGLILASREIRLAAAIEAPAAEAAAAEAPATDASSPVPLHRPILLAAAVAFALGTTAIIPQAIVAAYRLSGADVVSTSVLVALASAALLLVFSLPLGRFAAPRERVWALVTAAAFFVFAVVIGPNVDHGVSAPLLATLAALLAALACLLLIGLRANRALLSTRRVALFAMTPALWLTGACALGIVESAGGRGEAAVLDWWTVVLGVLALAFSLARQYGFGARASTLDRLLLDAGSGLVLLLGVARAAFAFDAPENWIVLLVAALGVLLASMDRAGLFNASSPRHQLGWLALAVATSALWLGLSDAGVKAPEPNLLPLAGALLLIAALLARFGSREGSSDAVTGITFGGAAVAAIAVFASATTPSWWANAGALPVLIAIVGAVATIAGALLLIRMSATRPLVVARRVALGALVPVVWLTGALMLDLSASLGAPAHSAIEYWWPAALGFFALTATLAWQLGALRFVAPPLHCDRTVIDASASAVLLFGAVVGASAFTAPVNWVMLLVAAVGILLASVDRTGLFNAHALRHQLGWLALALAGSALWLGLADAGVGAPQPYLLPLAAALLLIATLVARFGEQDGPRTAVTGIATVGVSAAALAVLARATTPLPWWGVGIVPLVIAVLGALATIVGCLLVIRLGARGSLLVGRRVALAALAPIIWLTGALVLDLVGSAGAPINTAVLDLWPLTLGLLALAGALAWQLGALGSLTPPLRLDRAVLEAGSAAIMLVGISHLMLTFGGPANWLALLIASVGALLAAIDSAGLFNSRTQRHLLGWLALALAMGALWMALADAGISSPEPYTLPLAAALLLIVALLARFGTPADSTGIARAGITAAGLFIGLVPSALFGAEGNLLRPILTIAIAGVILIGAVMWTAGTTSAVQPNAPVRLAMIGAGGLGVVLAAGGRALNALTGATGTVSALFELWVVVGAAVLVAAALANGTESRRLSTAFITVALVGGGLFEIAAIAASPETTGSAAVRAIGVVTVLAASHVLLAWLRSPALAEWLTPLALVLSGVAAGTFLVHSATALSAPVPFEWVTIPVAAAWLASGGIHLARTTGARSWPTLGPALALLLLPSLIADYVESPLWRTVGLGILAIAVLLVGLYTRLQAPFVLGSIVVLVHGLAQLWPWLSALYTSTPWWLWFGAGGVLLIAIAARYEQRVANVKATGAMIGALR